MQMQPKVSMLPNGHTRVELIVDGECVSWLKIVPMTIRVGSAQVRMDGIADVETLKEHRMKGYSRCVLEAAVDYMTGGDAAISMLYGISNFYPKFGYATAGPDHYIILTNLNGQMPSGWTARAFTQEDLEAVRNIYSAEMSAAAGAAIRHPESDIWSQLAKSAENPDDVCRVIVGPDGAVHGYVWFAHWCYSAEMAGRHFHDALVISEAVADSPAAADALLAACKQMAFENNMKQTLISSPPDSLIAAAAMHQDSRFTRDYNACGGSMLRVLDVKRLLGALVPEIKVRLGNYVGTLVFNTDIGSAALEMVHGNIAVLDAPAHDGHVIEIPQYELGRLALGVFPPTDILMRLASPPDEETSRLIEQIFPLRHPHMYLPDRF